jgi:hypothetical protein
MINQRSLRSSAARRHGPNPIRVDARAAVCPKRSSSPLLISSPQHPTDDPHGAVRCPLPISPRSRTTLIRLLIKPTGWARPVPAAAMDKSKRRHAEAARS